MSCFYGQAISQIQLAKGGWAMYWNNPDTPKAAKFGTKVSRSGQSALTLLSSKDTPLKTSKLIGEGGFKKVYLLKKNKGHPRKVPYVLSEVQDSKGWPKTNVELETNELVIHSEILREAKLHPEEPGGQHILPLNGVAIFARKKQEPPRIQEISPRQKMDLHDELMTGSLDGPRILSRLLPIVQAIDFIHRMNILHRDIKLDNILIKKDKTYLADFGASRLDIHDLREPDSHGTLMYFSPEVLKKQAHEYYKLAKHHKTNFRYSIKRAEELISERQFYKASQVLEETEDHLQSFEQCRARAKKIARGRDIWALGIVIYALVTAYFPGWTMYYCPSISSRRIKKLSQKDIDKTVKHGREIVNDTLRERLLDVAHLCLTVDPLQRPSAAQILRLLECLDKNLEALTD